MNIFNNYELGDATSIASACYLVSHGCPWWGLLFLWMLAVRRVMP